MNLISLENICKSYGEKILLNDVSLGISEGEKIGVIGINGTGKSTFLRIVANIDSYDSGNIITANKLTVSYLSQNTDFNDEATVIEQVFEGDSPLMQVLKEYESTLDAVEKNNEDEKLQKKLLDLTHKMDALNAWDIESQAKIILTKLGIVDFSAKVKTLSGGQKKRIALAAALIRPCGLLILDEPTNHIDNQTVVWLEEYLNSRKGALLMITHDRYFLDRVTNRIIELDRGNLYSYTGNYSTFLEKKMEREEMERASESKRQNLLRRELAWIRKGAKARTTKQKARIQRFEELEDSEISSVEDRIDISAASSRLGKKVIELNNISKSFGSRTLINDFSYIFSRGDRVGIIGDNGMGKSTLLNICAGKTTPDSGIVDVGETVKIGYFSQESKELDGSLRVIEYVREGGEFIKNSEGEMISASKMLENFLFTGDMQWTFVSKLSGGEKRRLQLLRVLIECPNVLILDEPTNDLDTETLTILEDYIESFPGTVITVSHDRYFLDKIAEKLIIFKGSGDVDYHTGNYSEYIDKYKEITKTLTSSENKKDSNNKELQDKKKTRSLRFSYKDQKEFDEIDGVIEATENKISDLDKQIQGCSSDYVTLEELLDKKKTVEKNLEHLYERWEYLNDFAEKIAAQKK